MLAGKYPATTASCWQGRGISACSRNKDSLTACKATGKIMKTRPQNQKFWLFGEAVTVTLGAERGAGDEQSSSGRGAGGAQSTGGVRTAAQGRVRVRVRKLCSAGIHRSGESGGGLRRAGGRAQAGAGARGSWAAARVVRAQERAGGGGGRTGRRARAATRRSAARCRRRSSTRQRRMGAWRTWSG